MTSTPRYTRTLLLGAVALALATAGSGCSWFGAKDDYTKSVENRPLEVPPDLDLPNTSAATSLPSGVSQSAAGTAPAPYTLITGTATANYPRVGTALEGIPGVTINGRAEALGSYDVTYKGESFLIRVQDSTAGGTRMMALTADGRLLNTGPAADLMAAVKAKL